VSQEDEVGRSETLDLTGDEKVAENGEDKVQRRNASYRNLIGPEEWTNNVWYGSAPVPRHNFPQLLEPWERDPEEFPFIAEMNAVLDYMQGWPMNIGQKTRGCTDIKQIQKMKEYILRKMRYFMNELERTPVLEGVKCTEGCCLDTRDGFLNVGVSFFSCGLYLVMMSSNTGEDSIAKAANFYLQKGIFTNKKTKCAECGHYNCLGEDMCGKVDETGMKNFKKSMFGGIGWI